MKSLTETSCFQRASVRCTRTSRAVWMAHSRPCRWQKSQWPTGCVVNGLCVSNQRLTASPAPCSEVDSTHGFAVLWAGAAHYLLVPTEKIPGIESSQLLAPAAPNYWAFAWQSRFFLNDTVGTPVPR